MFQRLVESRVGRWFRLSHPHLEQPRNLTASEADVVANRLREAYAKADYRQTVCWRFDCARPARLWVTEVGFDFKGDKADALQHVMISTSHFTGPVPGFCAFCSTEGPRELAEAVYWNQAEILWGAKPSRWVVSFTDGSKIGGSCADLDPEQVFPAILE